MSFPIVEIIIPDGKLTLEDDGKFTGAQPAEQMQYAVPGIVPFWLVENPERRAELAAKLRMLADACEKKKWPFEP